MSKSGDRSWMQELSGTPHAGRTAIWAGAAIVAFAAHAGAVALAMREPPPLPASDGPPPAFMIDMAPMPEAQNVDQTETGVAEQNQEEIEELPEPEEVAELPEPEPEPAPEPEPEPEEVPEELPQEMTQVENAAVPIAPTRPERRPERVVRKETPRETRREQPRREPPRQEQPRQAQTRAASQEAQQSQRNAASTRSNSGRGSSSVSPARWQQRLMAHIERRKRYPQQSQVRREQGTAAVRFSIDASGNVLSAGLVQSSGYPNLDQAALDAVRRSSPVPAPPPGAPMNITAPIRFQVR